MVDFSLLFYNLLLLLYNHFTILAILANINKKTPIKWCFLKVVGLPGIEPGLHEPESCVIPLYHSPFLNWWTWGDSDPLPLQCECSALPDELQARLVSLVGLPGIGPGLHAPHARVLPLYYNPKIFIDGCKIIIYLKLINYFCQKNLTKFRNGLTMLVGTLRQEPEGRGFFVA